MSKEALRLALEALEKVSTRTVIMGSTGDYREGQLDALSAVSNDVATAIFAIKEALAEQPAPAAPMLSLRDTLERPAYTHALALKNLRDALRWVDDWCETGPETGFSLVEEKSNAALADQPAQQEPVACPVCNQVHTILDADESQIVRNAKDGYPDGRAPRLLTLQERVTALCQYASDWKRWCLEKENTTPQAQPAREPLTDDELADLWYKQSLDWMEFARAIEAKLMEKNT